MAEDIEGGFALYVHWPFCQAKCPYCDFNSHVAAQIDQGRWAAAYEREIARTARDTGGRKLDSVFFGGGTPSLMHGEVVERVLAAARAAWVFAPDIEITLEANPTSAEAGRFGAYARAGVNRLSMGVQALNDVDLKALGRLHSAAEAEAAFHMARGIFPRISFDLIYARQGQGVEAWRQELGRALGMAVDHLSLYQLTIEDGTAFGARHRAGKLGGLPDEDLAATLWDVTQEITGAAGMHAYEVSNHARAGAESRHNLVYWRSGDWVGIGPGAHGRLTLAGQRRATEAVRVPAAWLEAAERGEAEHRETLDEEACLAELMLMGMRLSEGVSLARAGAFGFSRQGRAAVELADLGLIKERDGRLMTTAAGRPLLDAVLRKLLGA